MRAAYDNTCAYLGMRINLATAFATVDHFVPRDTAPHLAYEWTNFRLAAITVNTWKVNVSVAVDPFTVQVGEFALNVVSGTVDVGVTHRPADVAGTIADLQLNRSTFVEARLTHLDDYFAARITRGYLAHWFPFGESELTRQGI